MTSLALMAGLWAAAASPATASAAPAGAAQSGWGSAKKVPGLATLNQGGNAGASALACTSPGNCVTGGAYADAHSHDQSWLAVQRKGTWGHAFEVPGTGTLNAGGDGSVSVISCPSAGHCVATGGYAASGGASEVFVVSEHQGRWAKATALRGFAALNAGNDGAVKALSCSAPGDCTLGGGYLDSSHHDQAFLATEKNGHWAKAEKVPGSSGLNAGGHAQVTFVSCRKAGYCTVAGDTQRGVADYTAFVISEKKGHWGKAQRLPHMSSLNHGGDAGADAGSCSSAGNCVVGGSYRDGSDHYQAYLAVQKNGHWHNAFEVPGSASLNKRNIAQVNAASCASARSCAAGGSYLNSAGHEELFLISRSKGHWGKAREMPGLKSLNQGAHSQLYALSCGSAGNCAGVGFYQDSGSSEFAYRITESSGHWGPAKRVTGITSLAGGGDSDLDVVSCTSAGHCAAAGFGLSASHHGLAFTVSRT
jgi:hypothetical protein